MSRIHDEFDDDYDFSQQIKINAVHRDVALMAATDLLNRSKSSLDMNVELPSSDLMIVSHAYLSQREYDESNRLRYLGEISEKLDRLIESIDCAGANPIEFWMQSDIAAIDKAKELGISIPAEYSMADLRYKIHCAIREVL